jgi:nitric oxide reductase subunit B
MAADIWIFINLGQAILMSIPAINIYTHSTHVTVAHAMGTTIGINTMIIFAACFEFLISKKNSLNSKKMNCIFWILQFSLLMFWLSLNMAGILKGIWQLSTYQGSFSTMMESLKPYFTIFVIAGFFIFLSLGTLAFILIKHAKSNKINSES